MLERGSARVVGADAEHGTFGAARRGVRKRLVRINALHAARRDIYTGRYEFLERGWGPLEEDDLDLPKQVSGKSNESLYKVLKEGWHISYLVTDHFHLWEKGSGNYHMNYSGFDFIRGHESDAWHTNPIDFFMPGKRTSKQERHWRNVHFERHREQDYFPGQVFRRATDWLRRNQSLKDFHLHIDCFAPHEPWDPPEEILKKYWPDGYEVDFEWDGGAQAYAPWRGKMTEEQMQFARARYAAHVELTDRWLGHLLDAMDELALWDDTLLIFTSDHGTYNGDHGRMGKLQTHQHDAVGHIPFIVCHPSAGHGERRTQLVQLVDVYPTVLTALGVDPPTRPSEHPLHGINLLPTLENADAPTRPYAIAGQFGKSITITDGDWIYHHSPPDPSPEGNQPLYWHGHVRAWFLSYPTGDYCDGRRRVRNTPSWDTPSWLSDKRSDPHELTNCIDREPAQADRMRRALHDTLITLRAPDWQLDRLGLRDE